MGEFDAAGHDPETMEEIMTRVEVVAKKWHGLTEKFDRACDGVVYPDAPMGRDARRLIQRHRDNHVASSNVLQERFQGLLDFMQDGMKRQRETDEQNAERFHCEEDR